MRALLRSMLSEPDGQSVSSGRVFSALSCLFSLGALGAIVWRQVTSQDVVIANAMAASLTFWGPTLLSLVTAPYAITKGASTVADVVEKLRKRGE